MQKKKITHISKSNMEMDDSIAWEFCVTYFLMLCGTSFYITFIFFQFDIASDNLKMHEATNDFDLEFVLLPHFIKFSSSLTKFFFLLRNFINRLWFQSLLNINCIEINAVFSWKLVYLWAKEAAEKRIILNDQKIEKSKTSTPGNAPFNQNIFCICWISLHACKHSNFYEYLFVISSVLVSRSRLHIFSIVESPGIYQFAPLLLPNKQKWPIYCFKFQIICLSFCDIFWVITISKCNVKMPLSESILNFSIFKTLRWLMCTVPLTKNCS